MEIFILMTIVICAYGGDCLFGEKGVLYGLVFWSMFWLLFLLAGLTVIARLIVLILIFIGGIMLIGRLDKLPDKPLLNIILLIFITLLGLIGSCVSVLF